jgi:hypothetical protein
MPSFYSHVLNMLLLLVAVFIFIKNYSNIMKLEPYKKIVIALLFSITLGMHGISHFGLETNYNYNPLSLFKN